MDPFRKLPAHKFAIEKGGLCWQVLTPCPEGQPYMRYLMLCRSFDDAIARMDKWRRGLALGRDPEWLFKRIAGHGS